MRYPSLYKYVSIERLKGILIDYKVRFTQPGEFNDPFELVPRLWNSIHREPQGRSVTVDFALSAPRRPIHVDRSTIKDEWCHDTYFRDLRKQLDQKIGFLSMSRGWTILPMWAHYADKFAGAVIEFDGSHEFFGWAFDVHYSHDRAVRDLELYWREPIPIAEMCDKSKEWEYEKEVRLPRCLADCELSAVQEGVPIFVHDIPQDCMKQMILGERADNSVAKDIYDLIEQTDIPGCWAVIDSWKYDMRLVPFKLGGPSSAGGKSLFAFRNFRGFPNL